MKNTIANRRSIMESNKKHIWCWTCLQSL